MARNSARHGWFGIDLDLAELGAIKTTRALTDPVIVHNPTMDWAPAADNRVYDDVTAARLRQNLETPTAERIEYATWPETVLYFSTLTMDGRYTSRDVKELYQHSFRQYLDRWTLLDVDEQPEPISTDPDLTEYQKERLNDLRFGIKKDRDRYFVDEVYDDLTPESVPKAFWLTSYELDKEREELDEYSQSALDEFSL